MTKEVIRVWAAPVVTGLLLLLAGIFYTECKSTVVNNANLPTLQTQIEDKASKAEVHSLEIKIDRIDNKLDQVLLLMAAKPVAILSKTSPLDSAPAEAKVYAAKKTDK